MPRVVLAMSGGVDSSASALLLQDAGYDVIGVFMRHGEQSAAACNLNNGAPNPLLPIVQGRMDHKQGCCSATDALDARRVADKLGIPFYALDLQADFSRIVNYFVDEYVHGRTPNPCVQCNNWLKFGRLFDYADSVDAQFVATGHYAQLVYDQGQAALIRGVDQGKDQSYVLAGIHRELLPRMLLPVGEYCKPEIRRIAAQAGLKVANKRDSQEICFVTSGKHGEFIRSLTGKSIRGTIETTSGTVVGEHAGIENFTIGQRKRLGVALGQPQFVVRIDAEKHRVVIGPKADLARTVLQASKMNWLIPVPSGPFSASAQIRYNSRAQPAHINPIDAETIEVSFDTPVHGVAPGQLCVVYSDNRVLGGGWIVN